jgi:hypothetical protein
LIDVSGLPDVLDAIATTIESGYGFDHAAFVLAKEADHELARAQGLSGRGMSVA